ncbi:hypothetical protein ACHAQE_003097 [Botrytis cinerea]
MTLLEPSCHYFHPTASELEEGKRQAQKALGEQRRKFIATTSNKTDKSPSGWRYDTYKRIDDHLQNATDKRRERQALQGNWEEEISNHGTLENSFKLSDKLLPRSHTGRERSPKIPETHFLSQGQSNKTRDSASNPASSWRKPTSSNPVPTRKRRAQDVTVSSSSIPTPSAGS